MGRSEPSQPARDAIKALQERGVEVSVASANVADPVELRRAIDMAGVPVAGVLHLAGVVRDGFIVNQTYAGFEEVLQPKLQGALNLLDCLTPADLQFIVFFSSAASLLGAPGQSNYAAANAALDGLAVRLQARGLPAVSINWGPWAEAGMAAGMSLQLPHMSIEQGLRAFDSIIAQGRGQTGVLTLGAQALAERFAGRVEVVRCENDGHSGDRSAKNDTACSKNVPVQRLGGLPASQRSMEIERIVRSQIAAVMKIDAAGLGEQQALKDIGLDSLMALEVRNAISAALGTSLPATLLFDYPTVTDLTKYLEETLFPFNDEDTSAEIAQETSAEFDFEGLSERELAELFEKELGPIDER
jgi:acyl carrier protein/NAD(P)-dependent dehydrogenase (short-subunit alcohol dehydrogenase family)